MKGNDVDINWECKVDERCGKKDVPNMSVVVTIKAKEFAAKASL